MRLPPLPPGSTPSRRSALIRSGVIVFAIGSVATLVTVAPLFLGADPLPSVAYFMCMLMGVGFALAGAGLLRSIAAQRRQAAATQAPRTAVPPNGWISPGSASPRDPRQRADQPAG
ncbi:Integral membrane protein OS=Streptomyces antimycoticus OX=68175 GN=SSPO_056610 PE=4 SV=1 [Streptomyces antimycoticus]